MADGESLWLEVEENAICWKNFNARQRTNSRHFFVMNGVTLHKQLMNETGNSSPRHKLSVNIKRSGPSCALEVGKWYIHAHQVKIYNPELGTRWLGTRRLVNRLQKTFGNAYNPRIKSNNRVQINTSKNRNKPINIVNQNNNVFAHVNKRNRPPSNVLSFPTKFAPWQILKKPSAMNNDHFEPTTARKGEHFFQQANRRNMG